EGTFPGSALAGTALAPSTTDQLLTQGLRNSSPALFTLSGILTDPQFRMVLRALDQRSGADILASPEVTIISGRQAQMKAVEVKAVITSFQFGQGFGGGVGGAGGGGAVPSDRNIKTDFQTVDAQEILAKVMVLPISEWSYKDEPLTLTLSPSAATARQRGESDGASERKGPQTVRHIGPMAQDFKAAFKLGADD